MSRILENVKVCRRVVYSSIVPEFKRIFVDLCDTDVQGDSQPYNMINSLCNEIKYPCFPVNVCNQKLLLLFTAEIL